MSTSIDLNKPKRILLTKMKYARWVHSIIRADVSNHYQKPEFIKLVKTYQIHHHSKTCRKFRD